MRIRANELLACVFFFRFAAALVARVLVAGVRGCGRGAAKVTVAMALSPLLPARLSADASMSSLTSVAPPVAGPVA